MEALVWILIIIVVILIICACCRRHLYRRRCGSRRDSCRSRRRSCKRPCKKKKPCRKERKERPCRVRPACPPRPCPPRPCPPPPCPPPPCPPPPCPAPCPPVPTPCPSPCNPNVICVSNVTTEVVTVQFTNSTGQAVGASSTLLAQQSLTIPIAAGACRVSFFTPQYNFGNFVLNRSYRLSGTAPAITVTPTNEDLCTTPPTVV